MTDNNATSFANPAAGPLSGGGQVQDLDSICLAVAAAGEATYRWNIEDDSLAWSPVAAAVLNRSLEALSSGKRFAALLHPDNLTSRYDAVINSTAEDVGDGVAYHIEYQIRGDEEAGLASMWVEDRGRWFADQDGRPREAVGLLRPINERHSRDQKLSELSHTDPLTGMMNRTRLDEALAEAIGEAQNNENHCAFAVATIRNLDVVNEAYGFEVADEVIAALAERLRAVMRTGDGIARYSGSKFGFILNQCSAADLPVALERFLNVARDSVIETSHGPVWALLSVGAVLLPVHAESSSSARALAEESLSSALRLSSDSYVIHQPSEKVANARMLNARCAAEIVECLRSGKFQLAFQPLVDAATGKVACHEALLRMRDASGELVTAGHLVPVAERLGLIRLVDRAVVQLALETLHRHADACLSINLSATTANDPRWNTQIIEMIEMAGEVALRLTVEITETTALTDLTSALQFLERLRSTGCCVAIDDFGAGFTSFRNLRDLPIDVIKLDGSYCRNLVKDSENVYFARTLIEMAHHFGIRTVAEWVETEADAEILRSLGVDFLQGNHMGVLDTATPWTETAEAAFAFQEQGSVNTITMEPDATTAVADAIGDDHAGGETGTVDASPEPEAESSSPEFADISTMFEPLDVPATTAIGEVAAAEDMSAATFDPVESDLIPDLEYNTEPAAGLLHTEDPPSAGADEPAAELSGECADSVAEEGLESLDHAVDGSLTRLREALDLLTREISSSGAAIDSPDLYTPDAENARLAG
jgi:diguanylate cyclase (GGDEF)-like protein